VSELGGDVEPCYCDAYKPCEHRNYYIDPDTEVQRVCSGWVEGGLNLILHGTHGNWLAGIKECEPRCFNQPDGTDHVWCFQDDMHIAEASKYKSDKIGLPATVKPGWKVREEGEGRRYVTFPVTTTRPSRGLVQRSPSYDEYVARMRREVEAQQVTRTTQMLRHMRNAGAITEEQFTDGMHRLQEENRREAERMWRNSDGSWSF